MNHLRGWPTEIDQYNIRFDLCTYSCTEPLGCPGHHWNKNAVNEGYWWTIIEGEFAFELSKTLYATPDGWCHGVEIVMQMDLKQSHKILSISLVPANEMPGTRASFPPTHGKNAT